MCVCNCLGLLTSHSFSFSGLGVPCNPTAGVELMKHLVGNAGDGDAAVDVDALGQDTNRSKSKEKKKKKEKEKKKKKDKKPKEEMVTSTILTEPKMRKRSTSSAHLIPAAMYNIGRAHFQVRSYLTVSAFCRYFGPRI